MTSTSKPCSSGCFTGSVECTLPTTPAPPSTTTQSTTSSTITYTSDTTITTFSTNPSTTSGLNCDDIQYNTLGEDDRNKDYFTGTRYLVFTADCKTYEKKMVLGIFSYKRTFEITL